MAGEPTISPDERAVMEHALGRPRTWGQLHDYRNYFVAGSDHPDWQRLQSLCQRGLMRMARDERLSINGYRPMFALTPDGVAALGSPAPEPTP